MQDSHYFSQSYAEARERFLTAATTVAAQVECHVHPDARGREGEELSIDTALIGAGPEAPVLVISSGTHGVEGFCGSGCQIALLHDDSFVRYAAQAGVALLLVHAMNPYGFSHLRRVNEDNADLNRNFVDFTAPLVANEAYGELHPLLLPPTWPPDGANQLALGQWIGAHGIKAFQAAVTGGQYGYPDGMFFGGHAPAWSNRTLRAILRTHAALRRALAWIDIHTGLGPRAHGEAIYAGRADPAELARVRACWGHTVTSFYDGSSTSAEVTGFVCGAAHDECPATECTMMALEFGTLPIEAMLQALRAEHWLHLHTAAPAAQREAIKRAIRDAFYVDADDWKAAAVVQARAAARSAVDFLSARPRYPLPPASGNFA